VLDRCFKLRHYIWYVCNVQGSLSVGTPPGWCWAED
jgi:hypothetical protein